MLFLNLSLFPQFILWYWELRTVLLVKSSLLVIFFHPSLSMNKCHINRKRAWCTISLPYLLWHTVYRKSYTDRFTCFIEASYSCQPTFKVMLNVFYIKCGKWLDTCDIIFMSKLKCLCVEASDRHLQLHSFCHQPCVAFHCLTQNLEL